MKIRLHSIILGLFLGIMSNNIYSMDEFAEILRREKHSPPKISKLSPPKKTESRPKSPKFPTETEDRSSFSDERPSTSSTERPSTSSTSSVPDSSLPFKEDEKPLKREPWSKRQANASASNKAEKEYWDWTQTFLLKNGLVIKHYPKFTLITNGTEGRDGDITIGREEGLDITDRADYFDGITLNIHVLTKSTHDEFVAALKRDGNF
jgi:hypothetical protein